MRPYVQALFSMVKTLLYFFICVLRVMHEIGTEKVIR
jgi:hypothetical protein